METVLLLDTTGADLLAKKLEKYGNYQLRVASSDELCALVFDNGAPAVTVTPTPENAPEKSKVIALCSEGELENGVPKNVSDFVCEGFTEAELNARIMRLIAPVTVQNEKSEPKRKPNEIVIGALKIDISRAEVSYSGQPLHLTLYEYKLLSLLALAGGEIVTYKQILSSLWENPIGIEMRSIRVFINAIRSKLTSVGCDGDLIKTSAGKGYSLVF